MTNHDSISEIERDVLENLKWDPDLDAGNNRRLQSIWRRLRWRLTHSSTDGLVSRT